MEFLLSRNPILSLKNTCTVSLLSRNSEAYLVLQYCETVINLSF